MKNRRSEAYVGSVYTDDIVRRKIEYVKPSHIVCYYIMKLKLV